MRQHYPRQFTALLALMLAPIVAATAERSGDVLDCVIGPHESVEVSSSVPGLIEEVVVEHSDVVVAGEEVARLESGVEQASLQLAEAWASIDSEVKFERTNGALDQRRHRRIEQLFKNQAVALDDRDRAETEVALAELRVLQAQEKRWIRRLDAIKARAALERRVVRSPIDGVVVERYRSAGEYVENQPILRIARLDPLTVETILPMSRFGEVEPGMVAEVSPETGSDPALRAVVHLVDRMGDAASGTFSVRLTLPNPEGRVPAGIKCSMRFVAGERAPVPGAIDDQRDAPDAKTVPPPPTVAPPTPRKPIEARPTRLELQLSLGLRTPSTETLAAKTPASPRRATVDHEDHIAAASGATPCSVLEPPRGTGAAQALLDALTAGGAEARLVLGAASQAAGLLVVKPASPDFEAAAGDELAAVLRELQLMPDGAHRNLVSPGGAAGANPREGVVAPGLDTGGEEHADASERWWALGPGRATAGRGEHSSTACGTDPVHGAALVAGARGAY
jgi:RND family efflux transporter MFP subunit